MFICHHCSSSSDNRRLKKWKKSWEIWVTTDELLNYLTKKTENTSISLHHLADCYLQSKCFLLGPDTSSVVDLQTALAKPCPVRLCLAAFILSETLWPLADISICFWWRLTCNTKLSTNGTKQRNATSTILCWLFLDWLNIQRSELVVGNLLMYYPIVHRWNLYPQYRLVRLF